MNNRVFYDNLWKWKCGLSEDDYSQSQSIVLNELRQTEWSDQFETLMRNRLVLGAIRYGKFKQLGKPLYDHVPSMLKRLMLYQQTGNMEHLIDVANLCMCEYIEPAHPHPHFAAIDDGHHTKQL